MPTVERLALMTGVGLGLMAALSKLVPHLLAMFPAGWVN